MSFFRKIIALITVTFKLDRIRLSSLCMCEQEKVAMPAGGPAPGSTIYIWCNDVESEDYLSEWISVKLPDDEGYHGGDFQSFVFGFASLDEIVRDSKCVRYGRLDKDGDTLRFDPSFAFSYNLKGRLSPFHNNLAIFR